MGFRRVRGSIYDPTPTITTRYIKKGDWQLDKSPPLRCPCCGFRGQAERFSDASNKQATAKQVDAVLKAAEVLQLELKPGGYFSEVDAAKLLGITADGLRKQVQEHRCRYDYVRRGSRRFYRHDSIAIDF